MTIRPPAVAGRFYNKDTKQLTRQVNQLLAEPSVRDAETCNVQNNLRGLIVPHAGYVFSGETAGLAYHQLQSVAQQFSRVILVGPSHRVAFHGCALPSVDAFETPLGRVSIDRDCIELLADNSMVSINDQAHAQEHSLEVQLPFLQTVLDDFQLLPIVTGQVGALEVAKLIEPIWDNKTLLVISTDLSHFHRYSECQRLDWQTCNKIESGMTTITPDEACGSTGVNAVIHLISTKHYQLQRLALINSGDTEYGDKQRVVGYVSYTICR
ncbi:AmmeMemoRadiSam system protein B [Vibrio mediterranei]|uniref:AmmeMemoRadiSam system protein B n=1 Tax=Vibrio mediterranei TaxID=689 RepID=UPI001EFC9C18|nr:AmmeMemoRadiSam system protein B [Vibrio mediterranei]MCG9626950.1 AmmeMemoRadiSam system protein B [Vibrio mediterranei]